MKYPSTKRETSLHERTPVGKWTLESQIGKRNLQMCNLRIPMKNAKRTINQGGKNSIIRNWARAWTAFTDENDMTNKYMKI